MKLSNWTKYEKLKYKKYIQESKKGYIACLGIYCKGKKKFYSHDKTKNRLCKRCRFAIKNEYDEKTIFKRNGMVVAN